MRAALLTLALTVALYAGIGVLGVRFFAADLPRMPWSTAR